MLVYFYYVVILYNLAGYYQVHSEVLPHCETSYNTDPEGRGL